MDVEKKTNIVLFKKYSKCARLWMWITWEDSSFNVPPKKTAHHLFYKVMQEEKKSWKVPLFPRQLLSYQGNGRTLKLTARRRRSTLIFTKQKNNDMKRICRYTKKIIITKWRLAAWTKSSNTGAKAGANAEQMPV